VNNELYVANADSDTISVLDTTTNQVVRTIDLTPFPGSPFGAGPNGLAISSDGRTLYVANAFDNDIAVVRLGSNNKPDHINGLIPTGWIPSGVVLSPDNLQLAVINSKGLGAGPNLQGPNPYLNPESADNQYIGSMIVGTLSLIDVPREGELRQDTYQVFANDRFFGAQGDEGDNGASNGGEEPRGGSQAKLASGPRTVHLDAISRDVHSALQAGSSRSAPSGDTNFWSLASHECKNVFKASEVVGTGTRSPVSPPASHRQLGIRRPSLADSAEWADMLVALLQGAAVRRW
jgi:YVTN family beta-propeller protein